MRKYIKTINGGLGFLRGPKFNPIKEQPNWEFMGFDVNDIKQNAVAYNDVDKHIQYLPIKDYAKFQEFEADFIAEGIEIIDDDAENWKLTAQESTHPTFRMSEDDRRKYYRDELMASPSVSHKGAIMKFDASPEIMKEVYRKFERGGTVRWKGRSISDNSVVRVELTATDMQKIHDAIFDKCQDLHEEADTQIPLNPWPIVVE